MNASALLLALAGGYLTGSIPFGVIITRFAGLGDIRAIGSGNIGATNVLRTGRKGLALATLFLDGAKGAAAIIAASYIYIHWSSMSGAPQVVSEESAATIISQYFTDLMIIRCAVGIAAVIGHVFPIWLRFKGGKGVATAIGVYLALLPLMGVAAILTWLVTAGISRRSSVGGMVSMLAGPIVAALVLKSEILAIATALIAILVVARHADNIHRLIAGTEPKIGKKS